MKNRIKIEQALSIFNGLPCVMVSININGEPIERMQIFEAIGAGFYINNTDSKYGFDSRDNNWYTPTIAGAMNYIKQIIKNRDYYSN